MAGLALASCTAKSGGTVTVSSQPSGLQVPCDARRVLQNVCQQCHSNPTRNSAPFPLVTYDDTQVVASGEPLWHYMRIVVQSGVMPLPPVQISATDRQTLSKWLNAGAPAATAGDTCTPLVDAADGGVEQDAAPGSAGDEPMDEAASPSVDDTPADFDAADALDAADAADALQTDGPSGADDGAPAQDAGPWQAD